MSPTDRSDVASRLRMARRLGSAMTANVDSIPSIYRSTYVYVKPRGGWPTAPPIYKAQDALWQNPGQHLRQLGPWYNTGYIALGIERIPAPSLFPPSETLSRRGW